jgi:hypothetical protein
VPAEKVCPMTDRQAGFSAISPSTGELTFEVPITEWSSLGREWELSLSYNSGSLADQQLPTLYGLDPQPDMAHLSSWNGKWTHSWA